ncbi:MAG: hypothetical protein P0121_16015 [Nitrospira sp.]|nr:hypothetical protein [Nitrospira sp.]
MRGHVRRFVQRLRPRRLAERFINRLLLLPQRQAKQVRELFPPSAFARLGARRFRVGAPRVAGRKGVIVVRLDPTAQGAVARRVYDLEAVTAR